MKTAILIILAAALTAATALAAPAGVKIASEEARGPNYDQREVPAPLQQKLFTVAGKLELEAKSAYWLGDYKRAIDLYRMLVKSGRSDFEDLYNLACCYGQTGDSKNAVRYIKLAVESGFEDIDHIKRDPDFLKIRNSPCFQKCVDMMVKEVGRKKDLKDGDKGKDGLASGGQDSGSTWHAEAGGASVTITYAP